MASLEQVLIVPLTLISLLVGTLNPMLYITIHNGFLTHDTEALAKMVRHS
jgi:hypothetical protein